MAELRRPNVSYPDQGKVYIYAQCNPAVEPLFEGRRGEELFAELSTSVGRSLLGIKSGAGAGINPTSLLIKDEKVCWDLYVDCLVISFDGNLLDTLGASIKDLGMPTECWNICVKSQ